MDKIEDGEGGGEVVGDEDEGDTRDSETMIAPVIGEGDDNQFCGRKLEGICHPLSPKILEIKSDHTHNI